nr:MAG TPA: Protein of unknown function (DUF3767) [Caudoviricetes sp.]
MFCSFAFCFGSLALWSYCTSEIAQSQLQIRVCAK